MVWVYDNLNKTWIIENFQGEEIDISDNNLEGNRIQVEIDGENGEKHKVWINEQAVSENFKKYNGKIVIFRNCPNLKRIDANCLNLTGLRVEKCPNIERLWAYNNKIVDLNLSGLKKLKNLYVRDNKIEVINLQDCNVLENLDVSNNQLKELDLGNFILLKTLNINQNKSLKKLLNFKDLKNLEELTCFKCYLDELDCSGMTELWRLAAANQYGGIFLLNVQGCNKLEILDVAENNLTKIDCSNLPNLKDVSCKECLNNKWKKIFCSISETFSECFDENFISSSEISVNTLLSWSQNFLVEFTDSISRESEIKHSFHSESKFFLLKICKLWFKIFLKDLEGFSKLEKEEVKIFIPCAIL